MATTQNTPAGDGSETTFSFSFLYLEESDVYVSLTLDSTGAKTELTQTTDWVFASATQITFNPIASATDWQEATGAPKSGVTIRIYRVTDTDSAQSTFFAGSAIRAQDLNDNTNQLLYATQETVNRRLDRTGGTMSGELDMGSNKIVNVADPTAAQDAATKTYVDTADALKVAKAGDTMSGALAMGSNKITGLADPTASGDAATKGYVDGVAIAGISPGTANQILQTNDAATGVEWVDDVDIPGNLSVNGTGFVQVASGTSVQRDALTPVNGMFRYNTDDAAFEGYADGAWGAIGGGGFDVLTSPPTSPKNGTTYWDSEEGIPYIYYEEADASSSQWVPLVPTPAGKNAEGGGTDQVFFENDQAVTTNYQLSAGKNALSAGPITINSGVTVTVPSGQSWVIV